jgi:hypothetical protein
VVGVLTESIDGRKYWNKLKQRLKEEGNETVTNCHQLKLKAAGGSASKSAKDSIESAIGYRLLQIKNGRIKSYGYFND